jgi:hypothetical protein
MSDADPEVGLTAHAGMVKPFSGRVYSNSADFGKLTPQLLRVQIENVGELLTGTK